MGALEIGQPTTRERFAVGGMTCGSCARHVEAALIGVPGVWLAEVSLDAGTATVVRDSSLTSFEALRRAVAEAGYELDALGTTASDSRRAGALPWGPVVFGLLGALGLLAFYLGVITLAQGWSHAAEQLFQDRYFVGALSLGFGTQVGLFAYLHGRVTAGGLACCAHHLTEILPILGLSGATAFLGAYKSELLWVSVAMNLIGIGYMLWRVREARRMACMDAVVVTKGVLA